MKIINAKTAPSSPNPHDIKAAQVYNTEHAMVVHLTLEPGQSLKRHITPVDAIFYVLEGDGVVEIGGEEQTVGPDSLIDSPARIPHCWHNRSDRILRVLVIKVPRPSGKTQLL